MPKDSIEYIGNEKHKVVMLMTGSPWWPTYIRELRPWYEGNMKGRGCSRMAPHPRNVKKGEKVPRFYDPRPKKKPANSSLSTARRYW
jgi:hypothetical protein